MQKSAVLRAAFITSLMVLIVAPAAADWKVDLLPSSTSPENVSDYSTNAHIVRLRNTDEPAGDQELTPSDLSVLNRTVNSIYNTSSGKRTAMSHLTSGYYFANLTMNSSRGRSATFEIRKDSGDIVANNTRAFNIGNITVEIRNSRDELHDNMKFGETLEAEVNLTGWQGTDVSEDAEVNLWFTNGSENSKVYKIDNYQNGYFYNYKVQVPDNSDSRYIMYINASYDGASYNSAYGATSVVVNTLPQIEAEFAEVSTHEGCNNESFFRQCERGSELNFGVNITQSAAENVNMTLQALNETGHWKNFTTKQAEMSEGTYMAEFEVPDLDTSEYQKKMRVRYNATSEKRKDVDYYNFNYETFKTFFRSASQTSGGEYNLNVEFRKHFTPTTLNTSRLSGDVQVFSPDGQEYSSYTLEGMAFDEVEGWFTQNLDLPYGEDEGIWTVEVNATNVHGEYKSSSFTFKLTNVTQTFEAEDTLEREIDKQEVQEFDLEVENLLTDQQIEIEPHVAEEIRDFTTVNGGNNITLQGEETANFTVELNITEVETYESEIELQDTDSSYNETVEVSIDGPVCNYRVGPVCIQNPVTDVTEDEVGYQVTDLGVLFTGKTDGAVNLTASVEGNVSQYLAVEPSKIEMNATNDSHGMELNYSAVTPGYFTGNLTLEADDETEKVDLVLNSTVTPRDASFELSGDGNFGYIESGSDVEITAEVENTGNAAIDSMEFSSSTYSVSPESQSLAPGESTEVTITLESVNSDSGQVTVTASTAAGDTSRTLSVSGTAVPNYVQQANGLESDIPALDSQIPQSSQLQSELNTLEETISDVKAAYNQQNYERAEELYSQASSQLDSIQQRANQLDGGDEQNGGQDGQNNEGSGGFLIIAVVLVVLLLLGFVLYSSLIPEEGDPLYDVLGR